MQSNPIISSARLEVPEAVHFAKGTAIYCQGDCSPYWFEILSGIVRTVYLSADGRRQITGFFFAGEVFGADPDKHGATAQAVADDLWIRRMPWGSATRDADAMKRALTSAENSIRLLGYRLADARIAAFILDLRLRLRAGGEVHVPMPRADIADYLGLTIGTVSRTFADLVRRGLIAQPDTHHVRILDLKRLRILADAMEWDALDREEEQS